MYMMGFWKQTVRGFELQFRLAELSSESLLTTGVIPGIADEEKRALAMRDTIQQLPVRHRDCLEFLIFHLARVATRESENLVRIALFGPSLQL